MSVVIFIASSLDGFMAGPNDELDWLPGHGQDQAEDTFTPFLATVGALLMGRRTYEVVEGLGGEWPYGELPVLVATNRPLTSRHPTVRAVQGDIRSLLKEAQEVAGARDVYVDGGQMVRAALDAGLVDELTVTLAPVILGTGIPLFAGSAARHLLELESARPIGAGLVQLRYRTRRG